MVDVSAYWTLHSEAISPIGPAIINTLPGAIKLPAKAMESDVPPEGDFVNLLPPTIRGYNMVEKKWSTSNPDSTPRILILTTETVELRVDGITPVNWNKDAFDTLAVDADTKELIIALVSNKIAADKGTDLVSGKAPASSSCSMEAPAQERR